MSEDPGDGRGRPRRPVVRGRVAVVVSESLPDGVDWAWHDDPGGAWFFVDADVADRLEAALPPGLSEGRAATVARVHALLRAEGRRPRRSAQNGRAR